MANVFEKGERKVIPAVLIYARAGDRVLMIHRDAGAKRDDYHSGKWNGLGGKLDADESPLEAARRELQEESGLSLSDSAFRHLGVLQFPNFKAHRNEDWLVFVFRAEVTAEQERDLVQDCPEGSLHWVPEGDLLKLNLWAGDRLFLPYVAQSRPFIGTLWYRGQEVVRHSIQAL